MSASPLEDTELAAMPIAYGTALGLLARGRAREGETVLVTGASGGVGVALVQLAHARGLRVVALSTADKAERLRALGARRRTVFAGVMAEFAALGAAAGVLASAGASVLAALVAVQLFDLFPEYVRDWERG